MKTKAFIVLILAVSTAVPASAQQASNAVMTLAPLAKDVQQAEQQPEGMIYRMTLEDCLEYAFGNNYSRQSTLLNIESREIDYDQSRRDRLPGLSANVSENLSHSKGNSAVWGGSYGVSSNATLYQGGSVKNTIEQNRLQLEQTVYQTERYDNELTIQILQAFLAVLGNDELLKYQRSVLTASEEQMKQGEILHEVGSMIESDYLLLRSQYVSDRNNIIETEISRENSLLTLKSLMSMDPLTEVEVYFPEEETAYGLGIPDENYVIERAMETLPNLKISEYSVAIAETNVKIAKSAFAPTISLGGSLGTGHTDFSGYASQFNNRRNEQLGLTISIPIYNKGRTKSQVAQSRLALRQAELEDMQNVLDTKQTVIQEYQNVISANSRYETTEIRQVAYESSFNAYRKQFEEEAITAVDLLQQQNNYINALNDYIQAKYNFIFLRKVLDVYMGEPVIM